MVFGQVPDCNEWRVGLTSGAMIDIHTVLEEQQYYKLCMQQLLVNGTHYCEY